MGKDTKQKHIKNVIAITEVLKEGQKVTALAVEYAKNINNAKLSKSTFSVKGRTITKVYANNAAATATRGTNGKFAIIELSTKDKNATTVIEHIIDDRWLKRKDVKVEVTQTGEITTTSGEKYPPIKNAMVNNKDINLVVDDFLKLEYKDLKTGINLKYNLFIPKNYDKRKSYPMVVFICDRGPNCEQHVAPLIQSLGGVIWATPYEQAKHECFVLVPQYPYQIIFDDYTATDHLEITLDLILSLVNHYSIDSDRLYATGQSQGVLMSLEMSIRYPELFAGILLVSGFWDPRRVPVLAKNNFWMVCSEGDERSYPIMRACMASLEAAGAKITRATWDGRQSKKEAEANVKKIAKDGNNIKFTVFKDGTYITPLDEVEKKMDHEMYSHVHTWKIAYEIEGLRDWLLAQRKKKSHLQIHHRKVTDIVLTQK